MDGKQPTERSRPVFYKPPGFASPLGEIAVGKSLPFCLRENKTFSEPLLLLTYYGLTYTYGLTTSMSTRGPSASISLGSLIARQWSRL